MRRHAAPRLDPRWWWTLSLALIIAGLSGCAGNDDDAPVTVWAHQGQEAEIAAIQAIIAAFQSAHPDGPAVELTLIPSGFEHSYEDRVRSAALARRLPDLLEIDGPFVARYVWAGILAPLDELLTPAEQDDFAPAVVQQGTVDGQLYALGAFDSGLGLYYHREAFRAAGIAPPDSGLGAAWDWPELLAACEKLRAAGYLPLELGLDQKGEWLTYAFTPVVWSAGGRLLSADGRRVAGELNGPASVRALRAWQQLFERGYAEATPEPESFARRRAAMIWSGHWNLERFMALPSAVGLMPLPVLDQPVSACGSWCWGVTPAGRAKPGAIAVWRWLLDPEQGIVPMVTANSAPPARRSAATLLPGHATYPRRLFIDMLATTARPRPRTAVYPVLSAEFSRALHDIALGSDVQQRLDTCAERVQAELDRLRGS